MPGLKRGERPSSACSPPEPASMTSMITTGSVRGKCCAPQCGQSRRAPPRLIVVAVPQTAQKPWRMCQLSMARAWASAPRCSGASMAEVASARSVTAATCVSSIGASSASAAASRGPLSLQPSSTARVRLAPSASRLCRREQRVVAGLDQRRLAAEEVEPRLRLGERAGERIRSARLAPPIDAVAGEAGQAARLDRRQAVEEAGHLVSLASGQGESALARSAISLSRVASS